MTHKSSPSGNESPDPVTLAACTNTISVTHSLTKFQPNSDKTLTLPNYLQCQ